MTVALVATFAVGVVLLMPPTEPTPGVVGRAVHRIAYGSYMAYLVHRIVFLLVVAAASRIGEAWVPVAVVASIPLVLALGVVLQQGYDGAAARLNARNT